MQETASDDALPPPPPAIRRKSDPVDRYIEWYGRKKIHVILINRQFGWIWMMNTRSKFGFARITNPEWGYLSLPDIKNGNIPAERILQDELPATVSEILQKHPELREYFVE